MFRMLTAEARLLGTPRSGFDALVVGYPGHLDLLPGRRAARGRPVVFNPLVSLYDTLVDDRGRFAPDSLPARALRRIDRWALRTADLVVADTDANARYLAELAGLHRGRFDVCFVGAEDRLFTPPWSPGEALLFVGKLIPLHGLDTILDAARKAPELEIHVVGTGQLADSLSGRPANVRWTPWIEYEQLPAAYRSARAVLGIFGRSDKARRVIPNKVFQAIACGAPVITADTPAARELLSDGETALLVPPGDSDSLAQAMRTLAGEETLLAHIAAGGRHAYEERASETVLGARWRALLERLVG